MEPLVDNNAVPNVEMDAKLCELTETQLSLIKSISSTSQFLRFALTMANENLGTIRSQLETIRDLAMEIDEQEHAS
ncbi:hypothetical protein LJC60_08455 [Ruminococcaceae bacterium OttesenSCG-928-D13]|nr:hypothetical protein [Ruminococcaceae bacterium OttesenSCG-928-D13]